MHGLQVRLQPHTRIPFVRPGRQTRHMMKTTIQSATRLLWITAAATIGGIVPSYAADLQTFSSVQLVHNAENDGDSFIVETGDRSFCVRLYFVDCPETSTGSKSDAQRVREQSRYFGLSDPARTIHFGNQAKTFTERSLAKAFTVYTAFASAGGRSAQGRVYGFITTDGGNDLACLLVKNGFARTHGKGRKTPDGVPRDEMIETLRDLEISAMLKRTGIWSESDSDRIAELRATQRREDNELKALQTRVKKSWPAPVLLDLNTASKEELQSVKGIGPVLAGKIIAGRPYKTMDDLLNVKGISQKNLARFRPYFTVGGE